MPTVSCLRSSIFARDSSSAASSSHWRELGGDPPQALGTARHLALELGQVLTRGGQLALGVGGGILGTGERRVESALV